MVECVTWATERRFSGSPITQQFNLRYKNSILMEEWTSIWVNPSELNGAYEECDQYDTRYSEYLVKRNEKGQILGTIRTGPTTAPYMLKDHFAHTVEQGYELPSSPSHHELSRMAVDRDLLQNGQGKQITNQLLLAAQERGIQRGITAYWGIVLEKLIDRVFERAGYVVEVTGNPITYDVTGEQIYGVKLPVNEAVYRNCQEVSGIYEPILTFGHDEEGQEYSSLEHSSPILSDDFFQSEVYEQETGRKSRHVTGQVGEFTNGL